MLRRGGPSPPEETPEETPRPPSAADCPWYDGGGGREPRGAVGASAPAAVDSRSAHSSCFSSDISLPLICAALPSPPRCGTSAAGGAPVVLSPIDSLIAHSSCSASDIITPSAEVIAPPADRSAGGSRGGGEAYGGGEAVPRAEAVPPPPAPAPDMASDSSKARCIIVSSSSSSSCSGGRCGGGCGGRCGGGCAGGCGGGGRDGSCGCGGGRRDKAVGGEDLKACGTEADGSPCKGVGCPRACGGGG